MLQLVGERTAGAAVDVLVDGGRLEGTGVVPDIAVRFDPAFAAGVDPQMDHAIDEAIRLAAEAG